MMPMHTLRHFHSNVVFKSAEKEHLKKGALKKLGRDDS